MGDSSHYIQNSETGKFEGSEGSGESSGGGGGLPSVNEFLASKGYPNPEGMSFPTEADLVAQQTEAEEAKAVWAETSAGGLGLNFSSPEEAKAYLAEHDAFPNTPDEHAEEMDQELKTDVANIDAAMAQQLPTTADTTVFRGAGVNTQAAYNAAPVGSVITDKGFVSASTDRTVAEGFSKDPSQAVENPNTGNFEKPVIAVHVPEGSKGLWVNGLTRYSSSENEVILPRGSAFQVLSHEGLVTHVQYIGKA